jgi:hypothetical protein
MRHFSIEEFFTRYVALSSTAIRAMPLARCFSRFAMEIKTISQ